MSTTNSDTFQQTAFNAKGRQRNKENLKKKNKFHLNENDIKNQNKFIIWRMLYQTLRWSVTGSLQTEHM